MSSLLELNQPRQVDVNFFDWVHLYGDASFEPSGHSGVGGVLYDSVGSCLACFNENVSGELLKSLSRPEQKTAMFELEGLAVVAAFKGFSNVMRGKGLVVFTDNQGVQSSLVKCKSQNEVWTS